MPHKAQGPFDVKLTPQPRDEAVGDPTVGRMAIDKQFRGDLDATSKGEMLASRSPVDGSAGYVAIERLTGSLHGRRGAFSLQHTGVMTRGTPSLTITVIPDSATDALTGLTGTMAIVIEAGKHSYVLDYELPEAPP
ncbi:MAG TPA: DUF3224 domain-containing protein [Kofleriaceae bacterium]|jgi:hypothetical protein|nr:DUF3224 domain-containing protein [Kofleriaceae bacterium]